MTNSNATRGRSPVPLGAKIISVVMGVLFLLAVVVQYNDPDPIPWILIYGAAAVACFLVLRGLPPRRLTAATGMVAAIWAALLLPRVLGQVAPSDIFRETGMATLEIEEAREMIGLALVAIWMLVLFLLSLRVRTGVRR